MYIEVAWIYHHAFSNLSLDIRQMGQLKHITWLDDRRISFDYDWLLPCSLHNMYHGSSVLTQKRRRMDSIISKSTLRYILVLYLPNSTNLSVPALYSYVLHYNVRLHNFYLSTAIGCVIIVFYISIYHLLWSCHHSTALTSISAQNSYSNTADNSSLVQYIRLEILHYFFLLLTKKRDDVWMFSFLNIEIYKYMNQVVTNALKN